MTTSPSAPAAIHDRLAADEIDALVAEGSLVRMGVRPTLRRYVREVWDRRAFTQVLATSKAYARNQNTYLGQLWSLLNPLLNAIVYVVIFGFLLQVTRGVSNAIAFIVIGTFIFRFFETSINAGSKSIFGNLNLVRSVHFPRAVLPTAGVLAELTNLLPALIVMCAISWASGLLPGYAEIPVTWDWFLLVPTVALLWLFSTGCAYMVARWVAVTPDLQNVIPYVMRFLMYGSGVIFPIERFLADRPAWQFLEYQPMAVYLYLARSAVMDDPAYPASGLMWALGAGWALLFLVIGFVIFWRGEERYGRD